MQRLSAALILGLVSMVSMAFAKGLDNEGDNILPKGMKLPGGEGKLVEKVTKAGVAGFVIAPHTETVVADGEVRGDGWKFPELLRLDEVQIPEHPDKFVDLALTATPPSPNVRGAVVTLTADRTFSSEEILASEGVRIWSQTNCIQSPWGAESIEMDLDACRKAAAGSP